MSKTIFSREWGMLSQDTFSVPAIGRFVKKYLVNSRVSCDPFARNKRWATYTNDLNPKNEAEYHMDAVSFINHLVSHNVKCDLVILDPPYSPRQISECYKEAGITCGMIDTQNSKLYREVRNAVAQILADEVIVLSFGWNSCGMGKKFNSEVLEIMLCAHGGAHNDTICMAEKIIKQNTIFEN